MTPDERSVQAFLCDLRAKFSAISAVKAVLPNQEPSASSVCPTLTLFYRIKSLLPALRRRKQGPSES